MTPRDAVAIEADERDVSTKARGLSNADFDAIERILCGGNRDNLLRDELAKLVRVTAPAIASLRNFRDRSLRPDIENIRKAAADFVHVLSNARFLELDALSRAPVAYDGDVAVHAALLERELFGTPRLSDKRGFQDALAEIYAAAARDPDAILRRGVDTAAFLTYLHHAASAMLASPSSIAQPVGRHRNIAYETLLESAAEIYEARTGRRATITTHTDGDGYGGPFLAFARILAKATLQDAYPGDDRLARQLKRMRSIRRRAARTKIDVI